MSIESAQGFTIRDVDWAQEAAKLRAVRLAVFVVEQNIPEELEWDEHDAVSAHALARGSRRRADRLRPPAARRTHRATGRALGLARAGRRRGLLLHLIDLARERGHARVLLNAQEQAMPFYARYGFAPSGAPFIEAGIPHQEMARLLAP